MSSKTRYVQVGCGSRSGMFTKAIVESYGDKTEIVGLCDTNAGRMAVKNAYLKEHTGKTVPEYRDDRFDEMIAETKPDKVIVTTVDCTHDKYICRAMQLGCDVVTEKPMTTDETKCRRILETKAETGRNIQVTFNYRYAPPRSQLKELLMSGVIGEVLSVDFAWLLNTSHGADYFRRWHRRRENSGSLLVHKATHHFDLVNWWLDDVPEEVFCQASLRYYTPDTAERLGLQGRADRCRGCPVANKCKFHLDLESKEGLKNLYLNNEQEDGYFRDRCVFSDEIDIWDNMSVNVRYQKGAVMSYMLHSYSPWEGYHIAFNGTQGRLEHMACENTYISGDGTVPGALTKGNVSITLIPAFAQAQVIEPSVGEGGHGGADPVLLADVFDPGAQPDPLGRKADQRDGAYSILTGIAAYRSIDSGKAVHVADLLADAPLG